MKGSKNEKGNILPYSAAGLFVAGTGSRRSGVIHRYGHDIFPGFIDFQPQRQLEQCRYIYGRIGRRDLQRPERQPDHHQPVRRDLPSCDGRQGRRRPPTPERRHGHRNPDPRQRGRRPQRPCADPGKHGRAERICSGQGQRHVGLHHHHENPQCAFERECRGHGGGDCFVSQPGEHDDQQGPCPADRKRQCVHSQVLRHHSRQQFRPERHAGFQLL